MKVGDRVVRTDTGEAGVVVNVRPAYDRRPAQCRFVGDQSRDMGYVNLGTLRAEGEAEPDAVEEPAVESAPVEPEVESPPDLIRHTFGSKRAYELAIEFKHSASDYEGMKPQSAKGYTVADVRSV